MARPEGIDSQRYRISVVAKNFQLTDAIENYVFEKLSRIEHIADHIVDVVVTLDTQKLEHSCSILINFVHFHLKAHASTDQLYSSIDKATDRVLRLIHKYKEKMQSHRFKDLATVDIHVNVIQPLRDEVSVVNDEIQAETVRRNAARYQLHQVVAKETMPLKTLTHDEAIMKMEFSGEPFLLFRSEEDQRLKVLYRRLDENYGLVEIQA